MFGLCNPSVINDDHVAKFSSCVTQAETRGGGGGSKATRLKCDTFTKLKRRLTDQEWADMSAVRKDHGEWCMLMDRLVASKDSKTDRLEITCLVDLIKLAHAGVHGSASEHATKALKAAYGK